MKKVGGFCIFNHVAIGVSYLKRNYHIQRIAVVDFDVITTLTALLTLPAHPTLNSLTHAHTHSHLSLYVCVIVRL